MSTADKPVVLECDNCNYTSEDEDEFEVSYTSLGDELLYCKECSCCGQCREIIRG